jgi:hypothetical protein
MFLVFLDLFDIFILFFLFNYVNVPVEKDEGMELMDDLEVKITLE